MFSVTRVRGHSGRLVVKDSFNKNNAMFTRAAVHNDVADGIYSKKCQQLDVEQ